MRLTLKTKWLFPIVVIGLAVLVVLGTPSAASEGSSAEPAPVGEPQLQLAAANIGSPEADEAEFDDSAHGTY